MVVERGRRRHFRKGDTYIAQLLNDDWTGNDPKQLCRSVTITARSWLGEEAWTLVSFMELRCRMWRGLHRQRGHRRISRRGRINCGQKRRVWVLGLELCGNFVVKGRWSCDPAHAVRVSDRDQSVTSVIYPSSGLLISMTSEW